MQQARPNRGLGPVPDAVATDPFEQIGKRRRAPSTGAQGVRPVRPSRPSRPSVAPVPSVPRPAVPRACDNGRLRLRRLSRPAVALRDEVADGRGGTVLGAQPAGTYDETVKDGPRLL